MTSNKHLYILGSAIAIITMLWGCASIGNPSGGPRDEDPPRFVGANPKPGSVNVDPSNINIYFNELVNVKDAFQKVVLSPPGQSVPRVSTRGKGVIVNITDTLLPNTTYTIDFGDAIEDNNEGNKLPGFAYTFSTGPTLDSLRISGMVLGAEDMEPQQGVFVGAYISKEDSAFLKAPFERLARTDDYGRFIIRGLQDTTYRLFALKDLDNDKHYANPEEDIAWFEDIIRPTSERIIAHDTIRNLTTGVIDTIVERERTRFLPNNVLLRMFNTGLKPQYLVSYTRPDSTRLEFIFNSPTKRQPLIRIADDETFPMPLKAERTIGNDTLTFWLPRELATRDTLMLALEYPNVDLMTGLETIINDTVKLMKPKDQAKKKDSKKKKNKKKTDSDKGKNMQTISESNDSINVADLNMSSEVEIKDSIENATPPPTFAFSAKGPDTDMTLPLAIEVPIPLQKLDTLAFRLEMNTDSVWKPVKEPYRLQRTDTFSERRFKIEYPWQRGMSYRLSADSLAATDIYGVNSDKLSYEFKTKPEEDLSNLKITLVGLAPDIPAFVQLMASADKPKYTARVENGVATFTGIDAGKYYARLYEDFNGDGKYTTGSYRLQRVYGEPIDSIPVNDTIDVDIDVDFDQPHEADSISVSDSIGINIPDSIERMESVSIATDKDTLSINVGDSVNIDKISTSATALTDHEKVDSLKRIGYSFEPLPNDSVGKDILIAIQPDYVYYYPKTINVKKNWDLEQTWNVFETALDLQKPTKIKKNKPKRTGSQQHQEEEEEEDEDEFGVNPFDPNRRNNANNRNQGMQRTR